MKRRNHLQWLPLEVFGAWRYASSRCLDPQCDFCNPPRELVVQVRPAVALSTQHGTRPLW